MLPCLKYSLWYKVLSQVLPPENSTAGSNSQAHIYKEDKPAFPDHTFMQRFKLKSCFIIYDDDF